MKLYFTLPIVVTCVLLSLYVEESEGVCCPRNMCSARGFACCDMYGPQRAGLPCNIFCCNCDGGKCRRRVWDRNAVTWSEIIVDGLTAGKRRKRELAETDIDITINEFRKLDFDNNGFIEFEEAFAKFNYDPNMGDEWFKELDLNNDKKLSPKEFDNDLDFEF